MKPISILFLTLSLLAAAPAADKADDLFQQALTKERAEGNLPEAIKLYQRIVDKFPANRKVAAEAMLQLAECQAKLGDAQSRKSLERLVHDFADQKDVLARAQTRLAAMDGADSAVGTVHSRRLPGGPDVHVGLSPSWDGRFLPYVTDAGQLRIYDVPAGQSRRVGDVSIKDTERAAAMVSPDGKRIAYEMSSPEGAQLRISDLDGAHDRLLFNDPNGTVIFPRWFQDGRRILAILRHSDTQSDLAVISVPDGTSQVVYKGSPEYGRKAWPSPDGRYIAFQYRDEIYAIPASGGEAVKVVEHPATGSLVGWSPDGQIVFLSDRSGPKALWAQRLQNGRVAGSAEPVSSSFGDPATYSQEIGMSGEGAIFYTARKLKQEVYTLELGAEGLPAGPPAALTGRFVGANYVPDYSHDGKYLAYVSGSDESLDSAIRIRSLATGEEHAIPKPERTVFQVLWFPDGKSLLVNDDFRVDVQTGDTTKMPVNVSAFSADGKYLFYIGRPDPKEKSLRVVMRMDIASGKKEEIFRPAGRSLVNFALSPDGSKILYSAANVPSSNVVAHRALFVAPLAGGEPKLLQDVSPSEADAVEFRTPAWTPDGKAALFLRCVEANDDCRILRVPIDGGESVQLAKTGSAGALAVNPNGRQISWDSFSSSYELWEMENVFPKAR